jgi:ADP-heptose:LPS heptosyltransferase/GT2 family glycosyltransferase
VPDADETGTEIDHDLKLYIDRPAVSDGVAIRIVRGTLIIEGWALARGGVASIEINLDGRHLSTAFYGVRRTDIARMYPDWEGAEVSGFAAMVPALAINNGRHRIGVQLQAKNGAHATKEFSIEVGQAPIAEQATVPRRKMSLAEIEFAERVILRLGRGRNFSLLIGIGEMDEEVALVRRTLASLRNQAYGAWQGTILRRGRVAPDRAAARILEGFEDIAERIDIRLDMPAATLLVRIADRVAYNCRPDLIGVLLAGDVLGCDALLEMAISAGLHPNAEFFYSDERRISPASGQLEAFFKPQWSPDLIVATNYIGRFWCVQPDVLERVQATMGEWFQFGDYDLVLRCTEAASGIWHVPKLLCERGRSLLDHPLQERAALERALRRRGIHGEIRDGNIPSHYQLKRVVKTKGLVSIIIPTCAAHGLIKRCIDTLRAKTAYRNFEIICIENIPQTPRSLKSWLYKNADKVITTSEPFNWSSFNNLAAREAEGEFLLFLNDDTEVIEPGWLDALLEHVQRPEVGVVGARLLYPDRKVQHAGIFWTSRGGRHAFRRATESDPGYFGLALTPRNVLAVTGACMALRRAEFETHGGFDESHMIINNDVDYCLRSWGRGKSVVYTPYATLLHHEEMSRGGLGEDFDKIAFNHRWSYKLESGDPFYHPLLSQDRDDYTYDPEPLEIVYSSHPLFNKAQLRNILAVKLDHIGDFITAIPALRRLQQIFPEARLHLLAAPASAALIRLLPGLAEVIEFELFFDQSGLGQRELSAADLSTLQRRLETYSFDLAVDLRKWPETRPILQLTGARWLAGFDHNSQFPWLDIVMGWEQDPQGVRKRSHVSDDLVGLVEAISRAAAPDKSILPVPAALISSTLPYNPLSFRSSTKRFVVVHPGAGTAIKRWPVEYYITLIDLLVAAYDVKIALIGNHAEASIAAQIMAKVESPAAVRSLIDVITLSELPDFLASAALFVGNDSGPKHLAAGIGVPTIGIHSGTVDAREWGPIGANALAVRRDMICSPCYLSDPAQCWRGLSCLTELRPFEVFEICCRLLGVSGHAAPDRIANSEGLEVT